MQVSARLGLLVFSTAVVAQDHVHVPSARCCVTP